MDEVGNWSRMASDYMGQDGLSFTKSPHTAKLSFLLDIGMCVVQG